MAITNFRASGQGVRNTVRVVVKDKEGDAPVDRTFFIKKILFDCCGFQATDVFCLQDFPSSGYFDVTFRNVAGCIKFLKAFKEKGDRAPLSILTAEPLFTLPSQRDRVVTIHLYNPHVPVVDVLTFLARYVEVAGSSTDVKDPFGIWTSKRQVKVTLKVDPSGAIIHPPSSFAIGGSRGFLVYAGQPRVCRTCGKSGHMAANCSTVVCKNCKEEGHQTKDCKQTKCCNLCGAAGHLYKTCPKRCLSYAQAARSKERPGEGSAKASAVRKETNNLLRSEELQPEKEGEAAETNDPAPTQRPETPPPQTESMEEEAADGQTGQWQVVQSKTTKKKHPKATTQTSGKRRLSSESDCNNSSSLDGEMLERQPLQKRRQNSEMDDKASQPPGTGSCDGPGVPQPQCPTRNDVANASQLRDTGSKDTSGAPELRETGSCDVFEEEQMEAAEDNPILSAYKTPPMSPERHKPCMKNQEGFLSPTNVKLLAHTMGMQEHPEGEGLGLARTNERVALRNYLKSILRTPHPGYYCQYDFSSLYVVHKGQDWLDQLVT
ncbi:uncharacterized protein [Heterodontus francisci]|uniref:uncharacterized protein isoform X2 n=1 Tax=Heterodontus francisci TaxID=7792 RepID=UPI00355B5EF2